jgi:deazaflavin-dependent oxidoreductase (nitroreductase family)
VLRVTPDDRVDAFVFDAHQSGLAQDGPTKRDYTAREVTGDEKAVWWKRAVEAWPDYATYQTKTDRQIPVFVLDLMP